MAAFQLDYHLYTGHSFLSHSVHNLTKMPTVHSDSSDLRTAQTDCNHYAQIQWVVFHVLHLVVFGARGCGHFGMSVWSFWTVDMAVLVMAFFWSMAILDPFYMQQIN